MRKIISVFSNLVLGILFLSQSLSAQTCPGSSCSCGGTIIAEGCKSGWCCKPNIATCSCNFFSNSCRCGPENVSMGGGGTDATVPPIFEQNIIDFAAYLGSSVFSSDNAKEMSAKLPNLITASRQNDPAMYDATANRLEILAHNLPASEKQKANAWVASKGGTVFIE